MRIAFTGHRPNKLWNDYDLKSKEVLKIRARILEVLGCIYDQSKEPLMLITGMALGIDTSLLFKS